MISTGSSIEDMTARAKAGIRVRFISAAVLFAGLALAIPAGAQIIGPAGADNQPLQIQADSGVEWQQDQKLYIARGNAVATRGTSEVHADTLIAHYRDAKGGNSNTGGNTEIYRIEAEGHVTMKRDTQTVVGDRAIYDVDQQIAVVTGKGLKITTASDTVTARDSLEWYDQKQIAVARGDAVAVRTGKTIRADILTAYMVKSAPPGAKPETASAKSGPRGAKPKPKGGKPAATPAAATSAGSAAAAPGAESKISRVDAQGHVVITNTIDTGRGDFGVYNADTGIATLIGNVSIQRGKDVIRGQRGVMDLNNNVSRMLPGGAPGAGPQRVQGLFVREDAKPAGSGKAASGKPAGDKPAAEKKP